MAGAASRRLNRTTVGLALLLGAALHGGSARADPPGRSLPPTIHRICDLIEAHATRHGLPTDFFARLIWKESRFDPNALSPAGAQGIAQFMPGTARMRGLADPYDIDQAIPASARYLGELKAGFGNLGLAAAAYNAGESRVSRWLARGGFLPLETENYVIDIMGEPADSFSDKAHAGTVQPLDPKLPFRDACRKLPIIMSATIPMAAINVKPWGIQVAGNFRQAAAIRQWQRLKGRFPALLAGHEPVVSRVRTPIGRRGIYAVRIGADDRGEANGICNQLRRIGGSCVVLRNR
ncbi:lytic transglycosylase [Mesorhizobium sp. L-8-10]|uniref:lytic transglycosylase domain-containing protein n=1 Tax=unclassified Mesorhizobium TaxID=325217 RepID=UPI0019287FAE|nr:MULTISPECIES: lytic transglycosylase domain-containing protein [unclassified Mesorhizobium]BCH22023.1 lytic transglycosylase [Mesorhizobium sp. L-8-3]BCH29717.1 lytic transglycosylase [Mesorhizobium sp. L-8-10]